MNYGYPSAKGLRSTDVRGKGLSFNKRSEGPYKTKGHPCDLKTVTPASKVGAKSPTDLDPRNNLFFDLPKTRIY